MTQPLELVGRLQGGDPGVVQELLARHMPGLRGYVRLHGGPLVRSRESSADLVQSVCREVLEHIERFQYPSEAGFRQWLYTTALRKVQSRHRYWRAQRRDAFREVDPVDPDRSGPGDLLECYASFCTPSQELVAREQVERIEKAFDRLPAKYRDLIVMARIVGLSRREIGERFQRSEGAVRTMLSRALTRLTQLLSEEPCKLVGDRN